MFQYSSCNYSGDPYPAHLFNLPPDWTYEKILGLINLSGAFDPASTISPWMNFFDPSKSAMNIQQALLKYEPEMSVGSEVQPQLDGNICA